MGAGPFTPPGGTRAGAACFPGSGRALSGGTGEGAWPRRKEPQSRICGQDAPLLGWTWGAHASAGVCTGKGETLSALWILGAGPTPSLSLRLCPEQLKPHPRDPRAPKLPQASPLPPLWSQKNRQELRPWPQAGQRLRQQRTAGMSEVRRPQVGGCPASPHSGGSFLGTCVCLTRPTARVPTGTVQWAGGRLAQAQLGGRRGLRMGSAGLGRPETAADRTGAHSQALVIRRTKALPRH